MSVAETPFEPQGRSKLGSFVGAHVRASIYQTFSGLLSCGLSLTEACDLILRACESKEVQKSSAATIDNLKEIVKNIHVKRTLSEAILSVLSSLPVEEVSLICALSAKGGTLNQAEIFNALALVARDAASVK